MALHSNLQRRKTSYYFRQAVPSHLVPHIGKSEIVRSLKTIDPIIAKDRCRQLALEVSGWFDNKSLPEDTHALTHQRSKHPMPETLERIESQLTMDDLLERWASEQNLRTDEQKLANSYYAEVKRMVKRCHDTLGSLPISQINADSVRQVKESYEDDYATGRICLLNPRMF